MQHLTNLYGPDLPVRHFEALAKGVTSTPKYIAKTAKSTAQAVLDTVHPSISQNDNEFKGEHPETTIPQESPDLARARSKTVCKTLEATLISQAVSIKLDKMWMMCCLGSEVLLYIRQRYPESAVAIRSSNFNRLSAEEGHML